jgi:FkbM family methyltransferase
MQKLKKKLRKFAKKYSFRGKFLNDSYGQDGEDMVLSGFLRGKNNGFYVDVGAHHPKRYSNSYKFYRTGWKGINIDPVPGMKKIFDKERPRDINLEIGVGQNSQDLNYYIFNEPALNSFDERVLKIYKDHKVFKMIDQKKIAVLPLSEILDKNLSDATEIDFLNIDVEGLDYEVLQSNNWKKYRPKIILCEVPLGSDGSVKAILNSDIYYFLQAQGYELVAKTCNTMFFGL